MVNLGANVTLVDSLIPEYGGNLFNILGIEEKVRMNISDVRDEYSMRYLIQDQQYLFNLAGQTSHIDSMQDPYTDLAINSQAQLFILEACRKYNNHLKIVFASTRQIYGKPDYLPVDERHLLRPADINGVNKMAGEWFHIIYNNVHGVRTCVLRLTNTYGPCMRVKDARQTFLGVWFRLILEGKLFEVWSGEQLRDFTYIDDVVDAMLMAAVKKEAEGQIFNLGGDEIISLKDLADLLVSVNGSGKYSIQKFPEERKRIDIGNFYSDYTMIKKTLGWHPRITLNCGIHKTLTFYRKYLKHYI